MRHAFEPARRRLALSGTPFRSDTRAIPFLNYVLDEARPDFEYGYGAALADGRVVRPVYFPRTNGTMEWSAPDGSTYNADLRRSPRSATGQPAPAHRPVPRGGLAADRAAPPPTSA